MSPENKLTYGSVGVDVDIEAKAARILYEASKRTWENRRGQLGEVVVPFDDFAGLHFSRVGGLPAGTVTNPECDGVATKIEFAERSGKYNTLGFDLIAMACEDALVKGAEPVNVINILAINTLGQTEDRLSIIAELAEGFVDGCREENVAMVSGEIAQHNDRLGPPEIFTMDWSAGVNWYAHESRLLTGFKIKPGDYLIGLREKDSLGCNGISLVRRILKNKFGEHWEDESFEGKSLIEMAMVPSTLYAKAIVDMFGGWSLDRPAKAKLHGVAHITGSGIQGKLGHVLRPSGFGADILEPYNPPELMSLCQEWGGISDRECYRSWHMGQRMIIVAPSFDEVIAVAGEHGKEAKVIGQVSEKPGIRIKSTGINRENLSF